MAATSSYEMYYRMLGLAPGAPLAEIKRAYRTLAKQYHPDLNKAPDAAERFIEVNEAYEFLLRLHTVPPPRSRTARTATHRHRPYYRQPAADELFRQWMESERRKARARAAEAARKRYEEFRKSRIYRTSQIISAAYDYLFVILGLILSVVIVVILVAVIILLRERIASICRENRGTGKCKKSRSAATAATASAATAATGTMLM